MLNFNEVDIRHIYTHFVGNKLQEEGLQLTKQPLDISQEDVKGLLLKYFLTPFKNNEYYHLHHESDIELNEIYSFSSKIFADPDSFYLQTINISKHLYEQSNHPKIKGGEFYLVYFENCLLDNEVTDAIGLFKSETKETYLKVFPSGDGYGLNSENGININKLDKGCLIFNIEKEKGYKVCIVDHLNKSGEAQYWKDDFLKVKTRDDSFHYTQNYMSLCKSFVTDKMPEDFVVSKTDQIDILNRSVDFFKEREQFDFNEFSKEVIQQPDLIDSFKNFREKIKAEKDIMILDEFDISSQAVKKQAKVFKSVLKLDKNFHIYIHGSKEMIERGVDEAGRKFYKIYYKEES